jgi:hypothetical protein
MTEYRESGFNLERFYKALRFQYRDRDEFQQKYTVRRLDEVVREGAKLPDNRLEEYLDMFYDISTELTERGILSSYDRGVNFMKGLPKHFLIGERHQFNPVEPESIDYQRYFDSALKSYRDRRNIQELEDAPSVQWAPAAKEPERPTMTTQQGSAYPTAAPTVLRREEDDLVSQFMGLRINASEVRRRLNEADYMRREIEDLRILRNQKARENHPPKSQDHAKSQYGERG